MVLSAFKGSVSSIRILQYRRTILVGVWRLEVQDSGFRVWGLGLSFIV